MKILMMNKTIYFVLEIYWLIKYNYKVTIGYLLNKMYIETNKLYHDDEPEVVSNNNNKFWY